MFNMQFILHKEKQKHGFNLDSQTNKSRQQFPIKLQISTQNTVTCFLYYQK